MCFSPSSSLRSPANSADSDREASEVRLEEPDEAWLGGRLPISRLIQCSHKEELVEPEGSNSQWLYMFIFFYTAYLNIAQDCIITNYLQLNCWQTKMGLLHVSDRTECKQSAYRPHPQTWDEHRYRQSNTTVHQWSSYSEL